MKFLDEAKIFVKSGKGGPGCLSFRREKNIPRGGPDGGNGGKGGDVIFVARNDLNTLIDFRYTQHYKAEAGQHGMGRLRSGKNGEDLIIQVPVGTEILDEDKETVLADMVEEGQTITFLTGGDGGHGNAHYKSSTNQAPRKTTPGWPAEERAIWLRLKLIADIGIIGLPNAGKSTFLAAVSRAKPKIADYPFTTLVPNLGVIKIDNLDFVMADIPGLIEGAHEGVGLGHRFLGHVERTVSLLHVIDITSEDIAADYKTIRDELAKYDDELAHKKEIIALNKIDSVDEDDLAEKTEIIKSLIFDETKIFPISAVAQKNIDPLLYHMGTIVKSHRAVSGDEEADEPQEQEFS